MRNNTYNTLKIPATSLSCLSNNVHQSLKNLGNLADGGNCKLIELGGKLISSGLSKSENFGRQGGCFMGRECNMDSETDCRINRSVYHAYLTCLTDQDNSKSVNIGTRGRVTHYRIREHQQQVAAKSRTKGLSKHHWSQHQHQDPSFKTTILREGFKLNLTDKYVKA